MRRSNSVIQQDRMRKRNGVAIENALLSHRKKLNIKGDKALISDLNMFGGEETDKLRNVRRYQLRGRFEEDKLSASGQVVSPLMDTKLNSDARSAKNCSLNLKRKRAKGTPLKRLRPRRPMHIKNEESFAYNDSSDEEMPVKRKKLYTVKNGEQCAEMYKTDFGYQDDGSDFSSDDDDLIKIKDRWKEDWNQGVQVPVNKELPKFVVRNVPCSSVSDAHFRKPFQMPDRLIAAHNRKYVKESHIRVTTPPLCQYQCDKTDIMFLRILNEKRLLARLPPVELEQFVAILEKFELACYQAIHHDLLTPIARRRDADHDEETCCEICGQADFEEDDPIVFCEVCMVPVHQSCYGVEVLPKGDWICDVCREFSAYSAPVCVFCPFSGGPMKITEDGDAWAHISCALWIPEVRFGNHIRREPITRIDDVANGRWNLRCSVCDTSVGACIQCSHDVCTAAFHVTCALRQNFVMKIEHADTENVRMLSYCHQHSRSARQISNSVEGSCVATTCEKRVVEKMEENFFLYVSPEEVAQFLNLREEMVDDIYEYWKLKRADNGNRMLLSDRGILELRVASELSLLFRKRLMVDYELRHILEKVRNLCHMVRLRERQKIQMFTFLRDAYNIVYDCIANSHVPLSGRVLKEFREKLHIPYFNEALKGRFKNELVPLHRLEEMLNDNSVLKMEPDKEMVQGGQCYESSQSGWKKKSQVTPSNCSLSSSCRCSRNSRRQLNPFNSTF